MLNDFAAKGVPHRHGGRLAAVPDRPAESSDPRLALSPDCPDPKLILEVEREAGVGLSQGSCLLVTNSPDPDTLAWKRPS